MAARSSLLRRIAALAALAPRLVRLAHHDYPDGLLVARRELRAEAAQAAEVDAGAGRDEEPQRPAQAGERLPGPGHLVQLPGGVSERAEERRSDGDAVDGGDRTGPARRGGHVRP